MPQNELHLLKQGDPTALSRIYATYRRRIFWLGRQLIRDDFVIESLVQDTFLKLWLHRDTIESSEHIYRFLRFVMKRECISYYTRPRNRFHRSVNSLERYEHYADRMAGHDPLADTERLKQQEREQQRYERVRKVLPLLDTGQRHLLELCLKHGFRYKEIATALGTSTPDTVHQVRRAIAGVRQIVRNGFMTCGKSDLGAKSQGEMTQGQAEVLRLRMEEKRPFASIAEELGMGEREVHRAFIDAYRLFQEKQGTELDKTA